MAVNTTDGHHKHFGEVKILALLSISSTPTPHPPCPRTATMLRVTQAHTQPDPDVLEMQSRLRLIIIIPEADWTRVIVCFNRPDGFNICRKVHVSFLQLYRNLCSARKQKIELLGKKTWAFGANFDLFRMWNRTLPLPADTKTKLSDCLIHFRADVFFTKNTQRSISYHILSFDIFFCYYYAAFSDFLKTIAALCKGQRTFDTLNIWTV